MTEPVTSDMCPACHENLAYRHTDANGETHTYSRRIGVEITGAYDGVLFWTCPYCAHAWHRWHPSSPYRARAERYIHNHRQQTP